MDCRPFSSLAINIMLWGVFLMIQAASKNFTHLIVLRVLGGAVEAIADPAFMLITCLSEIPLFPLAPSPDDLSSASQAPSTLALNSPPVSYVAVLASPVPPRCRR
jgi:hypothetical protein